MSERPVPKPSELVYVPEPSWSPLLIAGGLMIVLFATFTWWVYGLVGVALLLPSLRYWFRRSDDDVASLPRRQRVTTSVLPAVPPKKPSRASQQQS